MLEVDLNQAEILRNVTNPIIVQFSRVEKLVNKKDKPYKVVLTAQWRDNNNQIKQPTQIVLRSDVPDYDRSFGVSPYIITLEEVKPVSRYTLAVQAQRSHHMTYVTLLVLLTLVLIQWKSQRNEVLEPAT